MPKYEDLEDEKVYGVITFSFLSNGGDGYTMFANNSLGTYSTDQIDMDIVLDYVKTYQPVVTGEEGRIEFDDGTGKISSIPV